MDIFWILDPDPHNDRCGSATLPVGTDRGQSQQTRHKVLFLQSLKVTSQFCKAGSGSALKKQLDPTPQTINADPPPLVKSYGALWELAQNGKESGQHAARHITMGHGSEWWLL